ncbi:PCMD domain-containing protein [Bacteroides sp.]
MRFRTIIAGICICLGFSSCIQDEALNAEADILSCTVADPSVLRMKPIINNNSVIIMAKPTIDITDFPLLFTLTKGATIEPASGDGKDFSTPQTYTVTSEDRQWKKKYTVYVDISDIKLNSSFEHWETTEPVGTIGKKWHEFYEFSEEGQKVWIWATANSGYALTGYRTPEGKRLNDPFIYPTTSYELGHNGNGVKLETKDTGIWGLSLGMPLAAGNLFIGSFDATSAGNGREEALKSTRFGLPIAYEHNKKPKALNVWYKYTPGEVFKDEDQNPIAGKQDIFDMYAILYESIDGRILDGSIQFDDPCIVAIARINDKDAKPVSEYTYASIPFIYHKNVDPSKLLTGEYYTAIVFSSSREGAYFRGAIGSTLIIDDFEIELEDIEIEQ